MLFFICLYNLHDLGIHMLSSPPPARSSSFYSNNYCPHPNTYPMISWTTFHMLDFFLGSWSVGHEDKHKAQNCSRACPWLSGHNQECNLSRRRKNFMALSRQQLNWSVRVSLHVFLGKTFLPKPLPVLPFPLVIDLWSAALPPLLSLQSKGEFLKIMMTLMFSKTRWSDLESLWLIECSCEKFW